MAKVKNIRKNNEDFLYALKNFESVFVNHLTSTEYNSVEEFFAGVSKEFVSKLWQEIDWKKLQALDKEQSFIEVDDEGMTRIFIAHQEKLPEVKLNGIEIFIANEITIDFFNETHSHFAVVGDKSIDKKWEYSEIDEAVMALQNTLYFPTKILRKTWRGKKITMGVGRRERGDFDTVRAIHPLLSLQRLFFFWIKPKEKTFYIDWEADFDFKKVLTKKELLQKLQQFLEHKLSRQELADWAVKIFNDYDEHKITYKYPDFDDAIYALTFADAEITDIPRVESAVQSERAKRILTIFEEDDHDLSEKEIEKMMRFLDDLES